MLNSCNPAQAIIASTQAFLRQQGYEFAVDKIVVQKTKEDIAGDYTLVLFPLLKLCKIADLGNRLAQHLLAEHAQIFASYMLVQGFLNLTLTDAYLLKGLLELQQRTEFKQTARAEAVVLEYSSPNTNKPLHLGHLRNIFLGYSMCQLARYNGYQVHSTCVVNDRGIHICKSMLAWKLWGQGRTPTTEGKKGDHLVGDYYVRFAQELKRELEEGQIEEQESKLMRQAREMLVLWEQGDAEVMALWRQMNTWVYQGFAETYEQLGISFDKVYYESETYLLGKQLVKQALTAGICMQKADGSIWIKLAEAEEKLLLRADGTSVYITQDLGLALQKYRDFQAQSSIYVVGDEQQYHFQALQTILERFDFLPAALAHIQHLSYGMVELTSGKMKSREGTVVDADELFAKMQQIAMDLSVELGRTEEQLDLTANARIIALAALKFFLLRIDPKKKMVFDPNESIDFQGFTGPFIQYTHARICSLLNKIAAETRADSSSAVARNPELNPEFKQALLPLERTLIFECHAIDEVIHEAYHKANPSLLAQYIYNLARRFNLLYANHAFLRAESEEKQSLRVYIAQVTKKILQVGADILGFQLPEKM